MVYIIPIVILLYAIFKYDISDHKHGQRLIWFIIYIYLTLLFGLRFEVGGDTINYMGDYVWRPQLTSWEFNLMDKFMPGYTLLCAIAKSISPEFYVFQLIHAGILTLLLIVFVIQNTQFRFSAFLCVYFLCYIYFSTEILRESLAIMIFLFNYKNLERNQICKYYIGVLISLLFHTSAIILIIIPFLRWLKFDRRYLLLSSMLVVILIFLSDFLNMFSSIPFIGEKILSYQDLTSTGLLSDFLQLCRFSIFPIGFSLLCKNGLHRDLKYELPIAIMSLLGIAAFFSPIIFGRMVNYFIVFFAVSFADTIITLIKTKSLRLFQNTMIVLSLFFIIYGSEYVLYNRYQRFYPYYSIFNPVSVDRDNYN